MTRHCSACGSRTSNRRIVCSSFESTIQSSCATVIASWLNVRSVVRNSRIVSEGPEGCGRLKIDLIQLIMFPPKFHLFEPVSFTCRIGIGRSLTAPPSHTTVHTDHVHGGSMN